MKKDRENSLTAREKGDIYWKKLKYNLQAIKEKNISRDAGRKRQTIANKLLDRKKQSPKSGTEQMESFITGNEFKRRPPTATGEQAYEDVIWNVIRSREYFVRILKESDPAKLGKTDRLVLKQLDELQQVMGKTISAGFLANGIDYRTGAPVSAKKKEKASEIFREEIFSYETAVRQFKEKIALSVVQDMKQDIDLPPVSTDMTEADSLLAENKEAYLENKEMIDVVYDELRTLEEKKAAQITEYLELSKLAEKRGMDAKPVSFMSYSEVMTEYEDYLREHYAALEWAKEGCIVCLRYLLCGIKPNPLMANYMHERWHVEAGTIPEDMPVRTLPGYEKAPEEGEDFRLYQYPSFEDARQAARELREYRKSHPRLFRYQTISAMLFDVRDLPVILGKAKALRNQIALWGKKGYPGTLSDEEKQELKTIWILAETMERVSEMVLEYQRENERKTVNELIETFIRDTQEMDYDLQKKRVRRCLEEYEKR